MNSVDWVIMKLQFKSPNCSLKKKKWKKQTNKFIPKMLKCYQNMLFMSLLRSNLKSCNPDCIVMATESSGNAFFVYFSFMFCSSCFAHHLLFIYLLFIYSYSIFWAFVQYCFTLKIVSCVVILMLHIILNSAFCLLILKFFFVFFFVYFICNTIMYMCSIFVFSKLKQKT